MRNCEYAKCMMTIGSVRNSGACPGRIRKGGGGQNLKTFFFCFSIFQGGRGQAQKIAEKMICLTKRVAKYR